MTHEVCEESGALAFLHRKPLILITAEGVIFLRQKARKKEEGLSSVQNIGITETPIYYQVNPHNHSENIETLSNRNRLPTSPLLSSSNCKGHLQIATFEPVALVMPDPTSSNLENVLMTGSLSIFNGPVNGEDPNVNKGS